MPDLSVIIVSWNVCDYLRDCLTSLRASSPRSRIEAIVVDSASTDSTPAMVRSEFPDVHLIEPGSNVGFSRGNNLGMLASAGRYLFLLNPDTKVLEHTVDSMVAYLDKHPEIGVLGPQLLEPYGTVQPSRRRFPTLWTGIFESTWLQSMAPQRVLADYYMRDFRDDEIVQADWLYGAAFVVRREVFEQLGGFDEGFFMYSEELDWHKRIKEAGWQVVYYPAAQVIHYGGKSSDKAVASRHIYFQTSKVRYFRKHHGPLAGQFMRLFLLCTYLWQLGLEAMKGLLGHKRIMRRERVQMYWQVLRSGLRTL